MRAPHPVPFGPHAPLLHVHLPPCACSKTVACTTASISMCTECNTDFYLVRKLKAPYDLHAYIYGPDSCLPSSHAKHKAQPFQNPQLRCPPISSCINSPAVLALHASSLPAGKRTGVLDVYLLCLLPCMSRHFTPSTSSH